METGKEKQIDSQEVLTLLHEIATEYRKTLSPTDRKTVEQTAKNKRELTSEEVYALAHELAVEFRKLQAEIKKEEPVQTLNKWLGILPSLKANGYVSSIHDDQETQEQA